jgi:RimJ/RimL family protein N-acetyltransferase
MMDRGMHVEPVTLEGRHVRLEPLSLDHLAALCTVGLDEDLWRWTTAKVRTPDDMRSYLEQALEGQAAGTQLPFVLLDRTTGQPIGSSRYGNIEVAHRRLEIGWTWLARRCQRTPFNTEAKYLLLRHAFERLGCVRVELKTDALNTRSRAAILRLGARQEGILRSHMIVEDGRRRDSVYYGILDSEWPAIKMGLEAKLARPWNGP